MENKIHTVYFFLIHILFKPFGFFFCSSCCNRTFKKKKKKNSVQKCCITSCTSALFYLGHTFLWQSCSCRPPLISPPGIMPASIVSINRYRLHERLYLGQNKENEKRDRKQVELTATIIIHLHGSWVSLQKDNANFVPVQHTRIEY